MSIGRRRSAVSARDDCDVGSIQNSRSPVVRQDAAGPVPVRSKPVGGFSSVTRVSLLKISNKIQWLHKNKKLNCNLHQRKWIVASSIHCVRRELKKIQVTFNDIFTILLRLVCKSFVYDW